MTYNIRKKIFWKGGKTEKTSLSLTKPMNDALKELSKEIGDSVPDIIAGVLEQFLVQMVKEGMVKVPVGEEENLKEVIGLEAESKTQAS